MLCRNLGMQTGPSSAIPVLAGLDDEALTEAVARNKARLRYLGLDPDTLPAPSPGVRAAGCWQVMSRREASGEVRLRVCASGLTPGTVCLIYVNEVLLHVACPENDEIFRLKIGPLQRLTPDARLIIVAGSGILAHCSGSDSFEFSDLCPEPASAAKTFDLGAAARAGKFLTKKGRMTAPRYRKPATRRKLARFYERVNHALEQAFGYSIHASHGTLLGLVRNGDLIENDDDFDCAYVSACDTCAAVSQERFAIVERLIAGGFDCKLGATGHVKLKDEGVEIDLMPSWFEDGLYCVAGHTVIPMARTDLLPLGQVDFHGTTMHVPAAPDVFLRLNYGADWRTPDPFYQSSPDKKALRHRRRFRSDQNSRPDLQ